MVTLGEIPNRDYLYNASENNPHGYGFAVNHGDRIVTGRSMKYERLIERFIDEMGNSNKPVGMFHARYTTHGSTTLENNHPFRVDGRHDIVLGHNGMLPITPRAGDDRSDTRIFAEDILGSIGVEELDDKDTFRRLERFTAGSKVAILSTAPELRDPVYILNEDDGHWTDGIWWSNSTYKYSYSYSSYSKPYSSSWDAQAWNGDGNVIGSKHAWWEEDADSCSPCGVTGPDEECYVCGHQITGKALDNNVCDVCNSCIDCKEHVASCLCYGIVDRNGNYNPNADARTINEFLGY